MLSIVKDSETWRICLRFAFTEKSDFGKLARDVTETSAEILARPENLSSTEAKPQLIYTGKTHLFHSAQITLLEDLFLNFLLAFVIITPILILVLRSVSLGLIAMLPNVFPTLVVFGWLGWVGQPIDLAIAMTACIALGIAVDDTTHFLIRFRDFGGALDNLNVPIKKTIAQCGPAMLHTTMIGGAGLIVYYFSDMLVVSRFSWAITILLMIALFADVVMLPAILFMFAKSKTVESKNGSPEIHFREAT
jgi:predicted RND superfamily exporter protein